MIKPSKISVRPASRATDTAASVSRLRVTGRLPESEGDKPLDDRPANYKVICISMYLEDLRLLDKKVDDLKARGFSKASRSALIRLALDAFDTENVKRGL